MTRPRRTAAGLLLALVLAAPLAAPADASAPATWKSRMAAAERYAQERSGTISFAVVDEAGRLHGRRARVATYTASLLKPMLLVAYLRRPGVRDRPLRQWERDLLTPMIRRSDNTNVPRLIAIVGKRSLQNVAEAADMDHFVLHMPYWGSSETTARGQARFFQRIDRLVPMRHRAYAMRLLATIVPSQRWGVGRLPHRRWRLYFKGAWSTGTGFVDHQVALYRAGGERFSLALFTRFDPDHGYGKETLRGLGARLLRGVPGPGRRLPLVGAAAPNAHSVVTAGAQCGTVTIRPHDGAERAFATGAASCAGFRLVSAGSTALWSWPAGGAEHLATVDYASASATDLGEFDSSDPLGPLAGSGSTQAYAHGGEVSTVSGPDCPVRAEALGAGGGRVAAASGATVKLFDPATCAVERALHTSGVVAAVALDDGLVATLTRGSAGRLWLEWFRVATGAQLGKRQVRGGTVAALAVRRPWILYRARHALRVLSAHSARSWTVWRPARPQLGARLVGSRVVWVENGGGHGRIWSLRLPARN